MQMMPTSIHKLLRPLVVAALMVLTNQAHALTGAQFLQLCASTPAGSSCAHHPVAQAYVGGALDLLAELDEQTEYLDKIYCRPAREIFDVPKIIIWMQTEYAGYESRNAMALVIGYLEAFGEC